MTLAQRSFGRLVAVAVVAVALILIGGAAGWYLYARQAPVVDEAQRGERAATRQAEEAETTADQAEAGVSAADGILRAACASGDKAACRTRSELDAITAQLDRVEDEGEVQEGEIQEGEIQEREQQEDERQDDEVQEREQQEGEIPDDEVQDDEEQDGEIDDPDPTDDPDPDDPDPDDPDPDDPDPNSMLEFAVSDSCTPGEGQVVTDAGLDVSRGNGVVTYTLTCQTAPAPSAATFDSLCQQMGMTASNVQVPGGGSVYGCVPNQ